jgi:ABC-type Fe3+-hydroxamate transport system substrate-binding protein
MTARALRAGCVALTLLIPACARSAPDTTAALHDASGRPVVIQHLPVQRIVSTMQSATEWLVLLGAANVLVARTDFDRQPELAHLPSIGGGQYPSAEGVLALSPEIVIGWPDRSSADLQHALEPFKIPVLSFKTTDTADALQTLKELGRLVGREAKAESLATALRAAMAEVKRTACDAVSTEKPSVFVVIWDDPPMTAGGPTWMTTLLDTACLTNAFADVTLPWPTVSLESIASRQPEWLLTSQGKSPGGRLAEFRGKPGWRDLAAVKAGRVIEIPGDLLARSGPTIAEAARAIVAERRRIGGK